MSGDRGPGPHPLRLFFALWPSEAQRRALAAAVAELIPRVAGHPVPAANLHVTLAFLGSVPGFRFVHLPGVGGAGGYPAVELEFDRLEYWPKPRVVVAMPSRVPPAGLVLVDRLWTRLEALGFAREQRPWRPHLTLVRRVRQPPPEGLALVSEKRAVSENPAPWGLALVESVTHPEGARYRPLAEWPLGN